MRALAPLRSLLDTWAAATPAFLNIGGRVFMMFFAYAYIGVLLFGNLQVRGWLACNSACLLGERTQDSWQVAVLVYLQCFRQLQDAMH
jgi:hypothetical protein